MITAIIEAKINEAVKILRQNGVIAYPTDTLYGLGADPYSPHAVERVFAIKGRAASKGLPLLLADKEDALQVVTSFTPLADRLGEAYWPGPLTLVLPARPEVPRLVTGGLDTIAVRIPNHWIPRSLSRKLGKPIIGTSANLSGGPDPVTAKDVLDALGDQIDFIVDEGPAFKGRPSTIVDLSGKFPRILREGAIKREEIEELCGLSLEISR